MSSNYGANYMDIFIPSWNFKSVDWVKKNCNYMKNLNPGWNRIVRVNGKLNENKKTKLEARQKQIKTKMTAVNKS